MGLGMGIGIVLSVRVELLLASGTKVSSESTVDCLCGGVVLGGVSMKDTRLSGGKSPAGGGFCSPGRLASGFAGCWRGADGFLLGGGVGRELFFVVFDDLPGIQKPMITWV